MDDFSTRNSYSAYRCKPSKKTRNRYKRTPLKTNDEIFGLLIFGLIFIATLFLYQ